MMRVVESWSLGSAYSCGVLGRFETRFGRRLRNGNGAAIATATTREGRQPATTITPDVPLLFEFQLDGHKSFSRNCCFPEFIASSRGATLFLAFGLKRIVAYFMQKCEPFAPAWFVRGCSNVEELRLCLKPVGWSLHALS